MAEFALFALLLVGSFVGMVVLWKLIDAETDDPPRMSREEAERKVRADDNERKVRANGDEGNGRNRR